MPHPITCPQCHHVFDATEAMVASVRSEVANHIETEERRAAQEKLQRHEADLKAHFQRQLKEHKESATALQKQLEQALATEAELRRRERDVQQQAAELDVQLERRLGEELEKARGEERKLAEQRQQRLLEEARRQIEESVQGRIAEQSQELQRYKTRATEAEQKELELRAQKQQLAEEKERLGLEVQRQIDAERDAIRKTEREALSHEIDLKLKEKNEIIEQMRRKVAEAEQKATQGSQQAQGEAQELVLLDVMREAFPFDRFDEIEKGIEGADLLQTVRDDMGRECGAILWESKRTKNFNRDWLAKVRQDQRNAKADCAALVSAVLPDGVASMERVDGVWVCGFAFARTLGALLRERLHEVHRIALHHAGSQDKKELVYRYLTSTEFQQRVQQAREALDRLRTALQREKTAIQRLWLQREQDLEAVAMGMSGMHRDLKTIAGADVAALPDVDGADAQLQALAEHATMPDDTTLERRLLAALDDQGGSAGNMTLRTTLGWGEMDYDRIKNRLVARGILVLGKGRGGSVARADDGRAADAD